MQDLHGDRRGKSRLDQSCGPERRAVTENYRRARVGELVRRKYGDSVGRSIASIEQADILNRFRPSDRPAFSIPLSLAPVGGSDRRKKARLTLTFLSSSRSFP